MNERLASDTYSLEWIDIIDRIFELSTQDHKTVYEKMIKIQEEVGELAEAILSYHGSHGCRYKEKTFEDVLKEIADVVTIALSLFSRINEDTLTLKDFKKMKELWMEKLDKWEKKINTEM